MLSLLCLHEPLSERSPLASLVPSVQWGQLTISGCLGGGAVRAPDLGRRKETGSRPGRRRGLPGSCVPLLPPSPWAACFSVLLLLSQPQVETFPGPPLLPPQPQCWWSRGQKFEELPGPVFSPLPLHWEFPISGPRGGDRVSRDLVFISHWHRCLCRSMLSGHLALGHSVPLNPQAGAQGLPTTTVQRPV